MSSDLSGFSMFDLFRAEAETHAQALSDGLLELESRPDNLSHVDELMRAAHSIKGAARIVNLDALVGLAHAMEDCFVAVGKGDEVLKPARVDQLLRGVDVFQALAVLAEDQLADWLEANREACQTLADEVRRPVEDVSPPAPPAATEPVVSSEAGEEAEPSDRSEKDLPEDAKSRPPMAEVKRKPSMREASAEARTDSPAPATATERDTVAENRAVPVSAENLNRILQLASESMIEARRLQSISGSLKQLRDVGRRVFGILDQAGDDQREHSELDRQQFTKLHDRWEQLLQQHASGLESALWQSERTSTALYHEVLGSRMRPFSEGTVAFPRLIRDLARSLGKSVSFRVQGGSVTVDRDILRKLEAPLNHLLRNCVDHGVEPPADRRANGKPEEARIDLSARHHAGMLTVEVRDDGRGIDPESIRRKVLDRQLAPPDLAANLSQDELFEFLFLPGFSTAGEVTEVSGRGVGLDVVQTMVQEVSGSVRVDSVPGHSTTFTLRLPVTLSVIRAALADISGEPYAFPLSRLKRILRIDPDDCHTVQGRQQVLLDGEAIGLVSGAELLGASPVETVTRELSIIVVGERNEQYGLVVDRFVDEQDLVVRQLDPRLGRVPHISAAAVTESGQPLLIVDVDDLLRSMQKRLGDGRLRGMRSVDRAELQRRNRILVVDDSLTVREVERQLLQAHGFEVDVAVDGRDGWNVISTGNYSMLITDIDMPRMNGIELIRAVRADDRLGDLPVIVISYKDREEDRLLGLEAGANAYLTKGSFHDDSFIGTVSDLMEDLD